MDKRTKRRLLIAARNLIADPAHWTRDGEARDKCGKEIDVWSPKAHSYSLIGAVWKVVHPSGFPPDVSYDRYGEPRMPEMELLDFIEDNLPAPYHHNDAMGIVGFCSAPGRTHEQTIEAFTRALNTIDGVNPPRARKK